MTEQQLRGIELALEDCGDDDGMFATIQAKRLAAEVRRLRVALQAIVTLVVEEDAAAVDLLVLAANTLAEPVG